MNDIQKQVSKIIRALVLSLAVGFGGGLVITILAVVAAVMSRGSEPSVGVGIALVVACLIFIGVLIWAVVLYFSGLRGFGKRLDDIGSKAMSFVFWSALMPVIGCCVVIPLLILSPFAGFTLYGIMILITVTLYIKGYSMLPRSTSFNEAGVVGAKQLKTAMMLNMGSFTIYVVYVVMVVLSSSESFNSIVPIAPFYSGGMIVGLIIIYSALFVLGILSIVFTFMGWSKIRKSFAN